MQSYLPEPGCIYDTLAFLSRGLDKKIGKIECLYYDKLICKMADAGIVLPHYLLPFVYRHKQRRPLLHRLLFDDRPYSECTLERAVSILKNNLYMRRCFAEHYFEAATQREIFHKAGEHPDGINLIKRQDFDPAVETYIYHTLLRFDEAIRELADVFARMFAVVRQEQAEYLAQTPEFIRSFRSEENAGKLRTLAGFANVNLRFSLTLLDEQKIRNCDAEPGHFLLGRCFADVLDIRYKYLNTDLFPSRKPSGTRLGMKYTVRCSKLR